MERKLLLRFEDGIFLFPWLAATGGPKRFFDNLLKSEVIIVLDLFVLLAMIVVLVAVVSVAVMFCCHVFDGVHFSFLLFRSARGVSTCVFCRQVMSEADLAKEKKRRQELAEAVRQETGAGW